MKDYIKLGTCKKVHGIKGEFSFHLFNKENSVLKNKSQLLLSPMEGSCLLGPKEFMIAHIRHGNKSICRLEGVNDRNEAEKMIPFSFSMKRQDFSELEDDEYYLSDLMGCAVFDDKTQEKIGVIESFYDNGAQEIIKMNISNKAVELPLVEQFFKKIDLENKAVFIIKPEYVE